jgi:hypothetical protein
MKVPIVSLAPVQRTYEITRRARRPRTHCKRGHELTDDNRLRSTANPNGQCRTCALENMRQNRLIAREPGSIGRPRAAFCKRGHPMVEGNLYYTKSNPLGRCLTCHRSTWAIESGHGATALQSQERRDASGSRSQAECAHYAG